MRSLLVIIDGLGDDSFAAWQGRTPFEKARHKNMDALMAKGCLQEISICENDIVPESCSCILRLLGVAREDMPQNRAYLELLANGRDVSEYEMVLRCNLVAVDEAGYLAGFNGMGLTVVQMEEASKICNDILKEIEFIHLSEYRNLLIMSKEDKVLNCKIKPPHESVGEHLEELLAGLKNSSLAVKYFLQKAEERLKKFAHDGLHYALYPWGVSQRQRLPSFYNLHKLRGAVVCKAEIARGIGKALGMEVCVPHGATGDVDTDLRSKAKATVELLQQYDFVVTHFNGTDEAAHRYDALEKVAFIERIDKEFLGTVLEAVQEPLKIVICGDHVTSSVTGKHDRGAGSVISAFSDGRSRVKLENYRDIIKFLMKECD